MAKGVDIIDLGVGDPDLPTPGPIIEAMRRAAGDPANHRYPSYSGMNDFKYAAAEWFKDRFGVEAGPGKRGTFIDREQGRAGTSSPGFH